MLPSPAWPSAQTVLILCAVTLMSAGWPAAARAQSAHLTAGMFTTNLTWHGAAYNAQVRADLLRNGRLVASGAAVSPGDG